MPLAVRIIPCLDVHRGRVVKGTKFLDLQDAGDPVEVAKRYDQEGADEITFLDITASSEDREITLDVVQRTAEQVFIPLTVGGGIRSVRDIRILLRSGADKVSINTAAIQNPTLLKEGAEQFGSQCIVLAIDSKKHEEKRKKVWWEVTSHGGRNSTGLDVIEWAEKGEKLGAGEILLTSMDADGTQEGYELPLLKRVSERVGIPVIASGGAGKKEDFYDAWKSGAAACLAASLFHYKQISIGDLKKYLKKKKMPIREIEI